MPVRALAQTAAQLQAAEKEVVLAGYGGTIEQFMRDKLIPDFEKKTGIKVTYVVGTAFTNYAKVNASRNNPDIDIYWSNELTHVAGKQQGLYEKLDPAVLTNLADVYDVAKDPDNIGVGSYILATGIQYNSDALKAAGIEPPKTWEDLWDPRYKGKIAMYSFNVAYSQDLVALMARYLGGTEKDVKAGIAKLKTLRENGNLVKFVNSPAELDTMMVQGQAWVTVNGSARSGILQSQGAPIAFSYPKNGTGYFTNYFDVVKNAPHPKAAQIFVNYLIGEEGQQLLARGTVAAPVNKKVAIPDDLKAIVPSPEEAAKLIKIDRGEMNAQLDNWAAMWDREIQGKR
ncbi:ABC transporter substrate-binding protein [Bosea sp. (in: a-proteobacteria)]|uniref:ABC transporter substrate-binding protein n=1 Tax=Bosea sp. (in: a-proteobacteria) TaxID=1871050 RepID=UPI002625777D|nr:ABC transporter substrate-binding protein [Bosea sp. (in: a-proteobacteria)]MCO5089586.1 ABC transporter substrate-binding protein [Bosea sp. (in: a-proteobacteria)]